MEATKDTIEQIATSINIRSMLCLNAIFSICMMQFPFRSYAVSHATRPGWKCYYLFDPPEHQRSIHAIPIFTIPKRS